MKFVIASLTLLLAVGCEASNVVSTLVGVCGADAVNNIVNQLVNYIK